MYIFGGFGILLIIIRLALIIKEDIEDKVKNNKLKKMSLASGDYKYLDTHGQWRLISNGHRLDIGLTDAGDCVTDLSVEGHPVIRNLSLEESQKKFPKYRDDYFREKAEKIESDKHKERKTYYLSHTTMVYNALNNHSKEFVRGIRFKDYETEKLYIMIEYGDFWWYMDIHTLKLVRLTEAFYYIRENYNRHLKIYHSIENHKPVNGFYKNKKEVEEVLEKNSEKSWLDYYMTLHINDYCSEEKEAELKKSFVYKRNMNIYMETALNNNEWAHLGKWNLYGKGGQ